MFVDAIISLQKEQLLKGGAIKNNHENKTISLCLATFINLALEMITKLVAT